MTGSAKRHEPINPYVVALTPKLARQFVMHPLELLVSPAWRAMPDDARRVVERLEAEHMAWQGRNNGALVVTYDQFVREGRVRRAGLRLAIAQASALGFLEVVRRGYAARMEVRVPSIYRLTFVDSVPKEAVPATNEWREISSDRQAAHLLKRARAEVEEDRERKRSHRAERDPANTNDVRLPSPGLGRTL